MRISNLNNHTFQKQPSFKAIKSITIQQDWEYVDRDGKKQYKSNTNPNTAEMLTALKALQTSPAIQKLKAQKEKYDLHLLIHDKYTYSAPGDFIQSSIELSVNLRKPSEENANKTVKVCANGSAYFYRIKRNTTEMFSTYMSNCQHIRNGKKIITEKYFKNQEEKQKETIAPQINSILKSLTN